MTYSTATVEGFVTQDVTFKKTKSGKSLCTFSIAIRHYSAPNSDPKVSFLEIETWEKLADFCCDTISKGKRVMIIGGLKQERWENSDGKTRSKIKLIGNQVRLIDSNNKTKETKDDIQQEAIVM